MRGANPLYPEKRESDAKGVLIALGSVGGAIAVLALIFMNFSYYTHPERLEGHTQPAQQMTAEAGDTVASQSALAEPAAPAGTAEAEAAAVTDAPENGQADASAEAPGENREAAQQTPAQPDMQAVPAQDAESMQTAGAGQDIESLEGTGVTEGGTVTGVEAGQPEQAEPSPEVSGDNQVFSDSSARYLTDSEVARLSQAEIQTAINEIFARHGYIFETQEIYQHFQQYSWYHPTVPKDAFDTAVFSDIETRNVELLSRYRQ